QIIGRRLGTDQPFYGFQWSGELTIEAMAYQYVQAMQTVQPEGPYFIGGFSLGGVIAVEMARLLAAQYQTVGLVALFDTYCPGYPRDLPKEERLNHHLQSSIRPGGIAYLSRLLKIKTHDVQLAVKRRLGLLQNKELPPHMQQMRAKIQEAYKNYKPHYYGGKIVLLRANEQPLAIYPDETLGWQDWVDELEIHEYKGHHETFEDEATIDNLINVFKPILQQVQSRTN
ncbi:MAG: thioesterase domain-containing protein, partial [Chloroflexota bacterium]